MAKVTITFEDKTQDGVEGVELLVECDPPVDGSTTKFTPAMILGIGISKSWDTDELRAFCEKKFLELVNSSH
jgi:hypothetical protein